MKARILLAIFVAALLTLDVERASASPANESVEAQESRPAFCGINSLYTALQVVGVHADFQTLLSPQYVSSTSGSTYADLLAAAKDQHAAAEVCENLSYADLHAMSEPAILHVRPEYDSLSFSHFVLVVPASGSELMIYDAPTPPRAISPGELAAIWDGSAMIVASSPDALPVLSRNVQRPLELGTATLLVFAALMLNRSRIQRWSSTFSRGRIPLQIGILAGVTCAATGAFHLFAAAGYFREKAIVRMVASSRLVSPARKLDMAQFRARVEASATIIDARFASDFQAGHIVGALNVPPDTAPIVRAQQLQKVDHQGDVVVYCAGPACPYASILANRLARDGFKHVDIFPGGWEEWSGASTAPLTSIAEIK